MSKMIGGGADRFALKPLKPTGSHTLDDEPDFDRMAGCHSGTSFGLNISNPQPGYVYIWERNNETDILLARQRGGMAVKSDDPEFSAASKMIGDLSGTPISSADIYKDVVLFRYPEEAVRRRREQEQAKAAAQLRSGAEEFVSQATAAEIEFSGGQPSRFARKDHRIDHRAGFSEASPLVEQWTPDKGIVDKG